MRAGLLTTVQYSHTSQESHLARSNWKLVKLPLEKLLTPPGAREGKLSQSVAFLS